MSSSSFQALALAVLEHGAQVYVVYSRLSLTTGKGKTYRPVYFEAHSRDRTMARPIMVACEIMSGRATDPEIWRDLEAWACELSDPLVALHVAAAESDAF
jgi:hypothetical protein